MKIEINNKTKDKTAPRTVKKTVEAFSKIYQLKDLEISIALLGDKAMKKLNKKWRSKDKTTDVLSFPDKFTKQAEFSAPAGNNYLGELILNLAQIKRQAKSYGYDFKRELRFICIHGLLHLLGYEDKTAAGRKKMEQKGQEILTKIKL